MGKIIGIDLGTTKSGVAYMDGNEPQVIPDEEGNVILQSVIGIGENEITVGDEARKYSIKQADRTITSIKRFMGRSLSDVRDDLPFLPFEISSSEDSIIHVRIGDRDYTPPELSAIILRKLK